MSVCTAKGKGTPPTHNYLHFPEVRVAQGQEFGFSLSDTLLDSEFAFDWSKNSHLMEKISVNHLMGGQVMRRSSPTRLEFC